VSIKVFVIDDSAVVRQTMQHLLQGDPDIELIGQRAQSADRRAR
jgi:two-component system chemotaxis response regulator CheB